MVEYIPTVKRIDNSMAKELGWVDDDNYDTHYYALYQGDKECGYVSVGYHSHSLFSNERALEIRYIFVLKRFRGMGFGRTLVDSVEEEAREMGIDKIVLSSKCHGFWDSLGYELANKEVTTTSAYKRL